MAGHPIDRIEPGLKIAAQVTPEPTREDLDFVRRMGVEHVVCWTDAAHSSYDYYASRRDLFGGAGGVLIPDHIPEMADDPRVGTAWTIAYMTALKQRAEEEVSVEERAN